MELIIGIIAGGVISWIITQLYYQRTNKEQNEQNNRLSNKLTQEVKKIILESNIESLSVLELNKLLEEKTIDYNTNDPLPFIICPKCGNEDLQRSIGTDTRRDKNYFFVECKRCGWSEWTE